MIGLIKSLFGWLNLKDKEGTINTLVQAYVTAKYGPAAGALAKDALPVIEQKVKDSLKK